MIERAQTRSSIRDGVQVHRSSSTDYRRNRSVAEEVLGSSKVVRDGVQALKSPSTRRLGCSFAIEWSQYQAIPWHSRTQLRWRIMVYLKLRVGLSAISNLSQMPLSMKASGPGTGLGCTVSPSALCPAPLGIATGHRAYAMRTNSVFLIKIKYQTRSIIISKLRTCLLRKG
jgi:hypothetical protein